MIVAAKRFILACVLMCCANKVYASPKTPFSFKKTFLTPREIYEKRNAELDQCEILERSNFSSDEAADKKDPVVGPKSDAPKVVANAHIHVRFGGEADQFPAARNEKFLEMPEHGPKNGAVNIPTNQQWFYQQGKHGCGPTWPQYPPVFPPYNPYYQFNPYGPYPPMGWNYPYPPYHHQSNCAQSASHNGNQPYGQYPGPNGNQPCGKCGSPNGNQPYGTWPTPNINQPCGKCTSHNGHQPCGICGSPNGNQPCGHCGSSNGNQPCGKCASPNGHQPCGICATHDHQPCECTTPKPPGDPQSNVTTVPFVYFFTKDPCGEAPSSEEIKNQPTEVLTREHLRLIKEFLHVGESEEDCKKEWIFDDEGTTPKPATPSGGTNGTTKGTKAPSHGPTTPCPKLPPSCCVEKPSLEDIVLTKVEQATPCNDTPHNCANLSENVKFINVDLSDFSNSSCNCSCHGKNKTRGSVHDMDDLVRVKENPTCDSDKIFPPPCQQGYPYVPYGDPRYANFNPWNYWGPWYDQKGSYPAPDPRVHGYFNGAQPPFLPPGGF